MHPIPFDDLTHEDINQPRCIVAVDPSGDVKLIHGFDHLVSEPPQILHVTIDFARLEELEDQVKVGWKWRMR